MAIGGENFSFISWMSIFSDKGGDPYAGSSDPIPAGSFIVVVISSIHPSPILNLQTCLPFVSPILYLLPQMKFESYLAFVRVKDWESGLKMGLKNQES